VTHERDLLARELIPGPLDGVGDRGILRIGAQQIGVEQELVVISHDASASEALQRVDDLGRCGAEGGDVSQADDLVRAPRFDGSQNGAQRVRVSVDVRDQADPTTLCAPR
jgi:hypothetical protein